MFSMLLKWLLPVLSMGVLCALIWVQLILRLSGKTLRGWLPTFFAAVLLVVLGLLTLLFWEIQTHQPTFHDGFAAGLSVRMAEGSIFSGAVYVGVTVWLYLFDRIFKRA
jgi:hypothetical protein